MKEPSHGYLAVLVAKTQKGDMTAFSELYALTYNKVYNFACHYLRDIYLAQDAVQEVYILALKNIKSIKDPMLFTAWLNQISFRTCFDFCKNKDANYGTVDETFLESFCDEHLSSNPEAHYEKRDEKERLQQSIEKLPEMQRSIVIMRFFNDMPLNDIANAMDISLSSVKRYLETAKNSLHSMMTAKEGTR